MSRTLASNSNDIGRIYGQAVAGVGDDGLDADCLSARLDHGNRLRQQALIQDDREVAAPLGRAMNQRQRLGGRCAFVQ